MKDSILSLLRPQGSYTKTDLHNYSELTAGRIKSALTANDITTLFAIFATIEEKDSTLASELEKRYSTLEGSFFTHTIGKNTYDTSIKQLIKASLDATMYGYGVVELSLNAKADYQFTHIDKEYFYFEDGELYLKTKDKKFLPKEPKFLVFKRKSLLKKIIWIVYAKHFVLSHYMKFTEFLGIPPIIVNSQSSELDTIAQIDLAIKGLKSGSYAVLGQNDIVKVLEGRGNQADFLAFINYADNEIAKLLNGSTLTSNATQNGSYALSKTHENTSFKITLKDASYAKECVDYAFGLLNIESDFNFLIEKDTDLYQRAQTLQILHSMGYTMNTEDISKEFDLKLQPKLEQNKRFSHLSANSTNMPLDAFDTFTPNKNIEDEILNTLQTILKDAATYEEASQKLVNAYPHIKLDLLEEQLQKSLANSSMLGYFDD